MIWNWDSLYCLKNEQVKERKIKNPTDGLFGLMDVKSVLKEGMSMVLKSWDYLGSCRKGNCQR